MKVAICGTGPLALHAAWHFHQLDASVIMFGDSKWGGSILKMAKIFPELSLQTESGLSTYSEYWQKSLSPLIEKLSQSIISRGPMLRVHKRFLGLNEKPKDKSRMLDLFRVVYEAGAGDQIHESFEDVDIVIDARGSLKRPRPLGPSASFAINESSVAKKADIVYGQDIFPFVDTLKDNIHCLLVGTGTTSALALIRMKSWLFSNPKNQLSIVTSEESAFSDFFNTSEDLNLKAELEKLIQENEQRWEEQKTSFEKDINEWKSLDEFVRVKMPKPTEPSPQINLLSGHNITAIDQWDDREGLFATCESADFKTGAEIKTLAIDCILTATGYGTEERGLEGLQTSWREDKKASRCPNGTHPEPGFFTLSNISENTKQRSSLKESLEKIPLIESEVLKFFTLNDEMAGEA